MANDAFIKPEIPDSIRDLVKTSIEQAKRAFDTFAASSEKTWKSLEDTSLTARAGLQALNAKIAEITRDNAEANFALALKLAESRDINQAMELQSQHAKKQMEAFVKQLEEMRDLAAQVIQEAKPVKPATSSSSHAASSPLASASSPLSSSSESPAYRGPGGYTAPRGGSGSSW